MQNLFEPLVKNGWLSNEEMEYFSHDTGLIKAIEKSTSPRKELVFNALNSTKYDDVKVFILGQDPYPNPMHAHGLAFSSKNTTTPASLRNIFKAIDSAYNTSLVQNKHNDLTNWSKNGVLLLNRALTYYENGHNENLKVWKPFIDTIIKKLLNRKKPLVMMLWGNHAQKIVFENIDNESIKALEGNKTPVLIPNTEILILQDSHPSPLNRLKDFVITAPEHFKECDKFLKEDKINWTNL